MNRIQILAALRGYQTHDLREAEMVRNTITFIETYENCFERSLVIGHVTGSAWILDKDWAYSLLIHHAKLDKWFQPGGHCDGDSDVLAVAGKEAIEETGLSVTPISLEIFDIDIHLIPAKAGVAAHHHYDIRYVFEADKIQKHLAANREIKAGKWLTFDEIEQLSSDPSLMRMVRKSRVL